MMGTYDWLRLAPLSCGKYVTSSFFKKVGSKTQAGFFRARPLISSSLQFMAGEKNVCVCFYRKKMKKTLTSVTFTHVFLLLLLLDYIHYHDKSYP